MKSLKLRKIAMTSALLAGNIVAFDVYAQTNLITSLTINGAGYGTVSGLSASSLIPSGLSKQTISLDTNSYTFVSGNTYTLRFSLSTAIPTLGGMAVVSITNTGGGSQTHLSFSLKSAGVNSLNIAASGSKYLSLYYENTSSFSIDNISLFDGSTPSGPSAADTQQSLVNTASVLQGTFTLQNTVMVNGFTYDCPVFDKNGICVSAGGRNTTVQTQGINNTNGLLIASYRLNQNNTRIGAWVDQNLSMSVPGTVQLGNSTPMIGLFGVWSQRPDGVGAEVKVSAAYGQKDLTVTRSIVGTSEPGTGGSQLISQGAQVVAKYGFTVMPDVVVSPYAGMRYTQNNMGGYTEAATSAVTAPLTYSALNTNATTALAGAEARYRGIPKTTLFASAGVETDTNTINGSYSAMRIRLNASELQSQSG